MVNQELIDLFNMDSMNKQFRIEFDGGVITNEELHAQSFELTESLCSEKNLRFGCCEASSIKFKISNIFTPLKDKWLTVSIYLNEDQSKNMMIGKYKAYSDAPTADRRFRDVVAYDAMYDIINSDVSEWYNGLTFPMTLLSFRNSFFSHFGIAQETAVLINDSMTVEETISPSELSGKDVITAICEINGVFGHIGRDGKFKYIDILKYPGMLYPADDLFPDRVPDYLSQGDNEHLYPQGKEEAKEKIFKINDYISCQYEDYIVRDISKLQIREEEGDVGVIEGSGKNAYVIQDNFLVYGKSSDELHKIAQKLFSQIRGAIYRPFSADIKGCPCFEVGDYVQLYTQRAIVSSYVLKRTLKGIQALRDDFSADGKEKQPEKVNDIHTSIIQLRGKSNVLERTIEETKSTITDVESGLQSQITQTAGEISTSVSKQIAETKEYAKEQAGAAEKNAKDETTEKLKSYSTTTEVNSAITQKADSITSTVSKSIKSWASEDLGYEIDFYGFGSPTEKYKESDYYLGKTYLDQESGKLYEYYVSPASGHGSWGFSKQLVSVESSANSKIEQAEKSIVLSVDNDGNVVAVELTADRSTGTTNFTVGADNISLEGKTINLTSDDIAINSTNFSVDKNGKVTAKDINITGGVITWSDIDTSGLNIPTSNDISSISKTTITKDYIETLNVKAGSVDAENITGTTISGKTISGGNIEGSNLTLGGGDAAFPLPIISINGGNGHILYSFGEKNIADIYSTSSSVFCVSASTVVVSKDPSSIKSLIPGKIISDMILTDLPFETSHALYGNNIHANGGHFYATAASDDGGDGLEHGVLEFENSTYTRDNVQYSVFSCCVGYSGYPTVLRGTEVRLKNAGGTVVSSDERIKNSFKSLEEFKDVYMDIEPCAFKYNNGTSGRYHFGFRAQNVENALLEHGYTTKDFAGFVQSYDKEGSDGYCGLDDPKGLIYTEFVAWNTHMIQKHEREKEVLELRVSELENKLSSLEERLKIYEQSTH